MILIHYLWTISRKVNIHGEHKPFVHSDATSHKLSSKHRRNAAYYLKHLLNISLSNRSTCRSPTDIVLDDSVWTQSACRGGTLYTAADPLIHPILLRINYPVKPVIKRQLAPLFAKSLVAKRRHGRVPQAQRLRANFLPGWIRGAYLHLTNFLDNVVRFATAAISFESRH